MRILTRSPLARADFELFRSFGPRLVFGMSLPTLRNDLARVYEPRAPAPSQRLATLRAARAAGLHVFVAIAPTYPECDEDDLRHTLAAVAALDPITIFHEPINVRAANVVRIERFAQRLGVQIKTGVFAERSRWLAYAMQALQTVEGLAKELGVSDRLHLWPDKSLGSAAALRALHGSDADAARRHVGWLHGWWSRVSAWPKASSPAHCISQGQNRVQERGETRGVPMATDDKSGSSVRNRVKQLNAKRRQRVSAGFRRLR